MRIYKYPIHLKKRSVQVPKGAEILCVQMQGETPTIWALIDPAAKPESRSLFIAGTGWDLDKQFTRDR